mmetsp:Transcript_19668/g.31882  ORF Transcript_19668/g.31882 Transcript_19668/m.31882 type:complete len:359 (-) Transcript_19668:26-1102(-)
MGQQAYRGCKHEAFCVNSEIICGESTSYATDNIDISPEFEGESLTQCSKCMQSKPTSSNVTCISLEPVPSESPADARVRLREKRPKQHLQDGSSFDGQWFQSSPDGHGTQEFVGGARYEGQWLLDRYHGVGSYIHADGSKYEGEWLDGHQHGRGREEWTDGSTFVGQYLDGLKTGAGIFVWPDGSKYEGQMFKNELSGEGTSTKIDKSKYTGQWVGNKMDGKGTFTWKDGKTYEGQYKNDMKHGSGVFVYADGRRYDGQWELGKMHGVGLWYEREKDGRGRKGEWARGKFQGWLTGSDEQSSRKSTTCSTLTNLELASFLSTSVLSDVTCQNSDEDYILYRSSSSDLPSAKFSKKREI